MFTREKCLTKVSNVVIESIEFSFTTWRVGLGSNRRTNHQTLTTNRAVAHPQYAEVNNVRMNDIAIIFLLQPAQLTNDIYPIRLPSLISEIRPYLNIQGMILGFAGSASSGSEGLESLQAAHVRAMTQANCTALYAHADANQHFCANDVERGSNFCLGDQVVTFDDLISPKSS